MNKRTLGHWGGWALLWAVTATLACGAASAWAQARFTYNAEGSEVTDTRTGLVWRRCSAGQSYLQGACSGTVNYYSHEQALAYAKTQSGWRLPNVKELSSIVDSDRSHAAIDPVAFPGTPPTAVYWTSSPWSHTADLGMSWAVSFRDGHVFGGAGRNNGYNLRLVR